MMDDDAEKSGEYTLLGFVESAAPACMLTTALQALRPQWNLRIVPAADRVGRYRIECRGKIPDAEPGAIAAWLHIKSALMAAFPSDKPNAVTAIDP